MSANDDVMRELFGRTPIVSEYRLVAPVVEKRKAVIEAPRSTGRGRWIEPRSKVGPRGGDGDRAKTKAARKANLRRRRKP